MAIECRACGQRNPDSEQFCSNPECGSYLGWRGQDIPPTQSGPATGIVKMTPAKVPAAAATVALSDSALAVAPGESVVTTVTVHNGGEQVEQFAISVAGPVGAWSVAEPPTVRVFPGERTQCSVRITPPRRPDTAAGRAWFVVQATSVLHPGLSAHANGILDVAAFRDLSATITPPGGSARWRSRHQLDVVNGGNTGEAVRVQATDATGRLRFSVPPGEVPLANGARWSHAMPLRSPLRLLGRPQSYPFQVTVTPRPPSQPIRLDGTREGIPLIAGWIPKLVTVLALLAAAAAAVAVIRPQLNSKPVAVNSPAANGVASPSVQPPSSAAVSPSGAPSTAASRTVSPSASASTQSGGGPLCLMCFPLPLLSTESCTTGYVWRAAFASDYVCVTDAVAARVKADNGNAGKLWTKGSYGLDTCVVGYVWREASPTDHVCVTPDVRTQAMQDNALTTPRRVFPPKQCIAGYVWRTAFPTDYVCVNAAGKAQAASDNSQSNARRDVNATPGVWKCLPGYVFRQARPTDQVCVTPAVQSQTAYDNSQASSRTR